ncbi:DUF1559 domain-containing protein [Thalassoglobus neptunius]|uniref:DUF1559 domain-containing protein n=1 Tax=Thalassoglobus neptunius TaxID=1938619 RepID=UPI001E2C11B6|nr:DUF1559 domain-containing protein [Thalassoglobus neptunius]
MRVRDLSRRGQTIQCPDCSQPVLLEEQDGRLVGVEPIQLPESLQSRVGSSFPVRILLVGILVVTWIVWFLLKPETVSTDTATHSETSVPEESLETSGGTDVGPITIEGDGSANETNEADVDGNGLLQQRLKGIYDSLDRNLALTGSYANGMDLTRDESVPRWSWIAQLERQENAGNLSLDWKAAWNDRQNDSFVRRRLEQYQNPEVTRLAGDDRYPATHFAGVSGVGPDSERLSINHPRAGIFSPFRTVQKSDIVDGTSNTMLIVGVQSMLGAWARPGNATIRSFNQEPYVNGPDGIGTGDQDSMLVLMADGSVKQVSAETDPRIIRRMAAMADGLSLETDENGTPVEFDDRVEEEPEDSSDHEPVLPLLASDAAPFSIDERLEQRLVEYRLVNPTQVGILLREFSEIAGVSVDHSDVDPEQLDHRVTLSLQDVDLLELLKEITASVGLDFEVQARRIRILPKDDPSKSPQD